MGLLRLVHSRIRGMVDGITYWLGNTRSARVGMPCGVIRARELTEYGVLHFCSVAPSFRPEALAAVTILGCSYHFIHLSRNAYARSSLWVGKAVKEAAARGSHGASVHSKYDSSL